MILPDLQLPSRVNHYCFYSGIDSYDYCMDKQHFLQYPYRIIYQFNSRGFRDSEWPSHMHDLQKAIWCVGDSFTVGIGQPFDHIWPQVLQRAIPSRVINVSMDGASNDWIFRKALQILHDVNPDVVICMWSYTNRRESPNEELDDEDRRQFSSHASYSQDLAHWRQLKSMLVDDHANQVISCTVPDFHPTADIEDIWKAVSNPSWGPCPENLQKLHALDNHIKDKLQAVHQCFDRMQDLYRMLEAGCAVSRYIQPAAPKIIATNHRLDWARDHHHFDILTAEWVVQQILDQINLMAVSKICSPDQSVDA